MISFDTCLKLEQGDLGMDEDVSMVSHAHFDHLPSSYKDKKIICSEITGKMISARKKVKEINPYKTSKIKMLDAGHILGSNMFLVNKKFLYTGDFNTQGEYCGKAVPTRCETLVIECTFAKPEYIFPSKKQVIAELKDYLLKNNKAFIMTTDSFGKPQELCAALEKCKIAFNTSENISRINNYLGLDFKYFDAKSEIVISNSIDYSKNYKKVFMSGWANTNKGKFGYDKGFVFSSHCDYPSLVEFVKKCSPDKVYTHHGYAFEFARDLRKIGYDAETLSGINITKRRLKEHQSTL